MRDTENNQRRTIIVAKDGSGDYTSLQEAVDSVPEGENSETCIFLRAGEYHEKVVIHRNDIHLTGKRLSWHGTGVPRICMMTGQKRVHSFLPP